MKYIIYLLMAISIYSIEIKELSENKYLVKDYIHIENISPEQGRSRLIENMRREILAYVHGIKVNSNSISQSTSNGENTFDIVSSQSVDGFIIAERIINQARAIREDRFALELEVEFEIGKQKGAIDTSYNIFVSNLENIYRVGEEFKFQYELSKDSYVYIFIRDSQNNMYMYYPNVIHRENYIKEKNKVEFPPKEYSIYMSTGDKKEATESLIVIGARKPINFVGFEYKPDYGVSISNYENYIRQLIRMDKGDIVISEQVYKIIK